VGDHTDRGDRNHPHQEVTVRRRQTGLEHDASREWRWCGHDDALGCHDQLVGVHLDPKIVVGDRSHWPAELECVTPSITRANILPSTLNTLTPSPNG
jgi:hypothetical protein